jgi:parallel beta-helix repeat protein
VAAWVSDTAFIGNGNYPLRTRADNLHRALSGNTFSGNTPNRLLTFGTLPASLTFGIANGLAGYELEDDLTVPAGLTLTVEPDTTIWGRSSSELRVEGYLSAVGTAAQPIVFTSAQDTAGYQWSGLVFDGGSGNLEHATVRYGGNPNSVSEPYYNWGANITARNVPAGTLRIASSQVLTSTSYYGLYAADSHVVVSDTLFSGVGYSAALYATGVSTVTVTGATVQNNPGYGIYLNGADAATLTGNTIRANNGGGVYLNNSDAALRGNIIRENYAANGGGLYVAGDSRPALVNNVLLANRAGSAGSALYVAGSARPALLHTTLANNSGGDGSGVYVASGAAAIFTNTIVYSHTVGVAAAAAVTLANTLWDANASDFTGAVGETGRVTGPAAFASDGYHLGPGSAALERGLDAGVSEDLDGESRPQPAGTPPDLGADESPLAPPAVIVAPPATAVTLTLPHGEGELALPAGLVTTTTTFTYTEMLTPTQATGSFAFAGRSFTLNATDAAGQPVTTFAGRYTITLNYLDSDWQNAGIPAEANLNLYYWNGTAWVGILPCAGCSLDTVNNRITVVLDHLTEFALLGNPLAAPAISASRESNGLALRWTQTQDGVVRYEVYRSTNPYFTPASGQKLNPDVSPPGMGNQATFTDAAAFAAPLTNYYYLVLAVGAGEVRSPASNRVAAFHFPLTPGAQ